MSSDFSDLKRAASNDAPLVLVAKSAISGTIEYPSEVWLDGSFDGTLVCHTAMIGKTAKFTGMLVADKAVIAGEVDADIYADNLTLKSGCNVVGEIFHGHLNIEEAAYFDGKSRRHSNTKQLGLERCDLGTTP
jgi:cytoskeletal protein CcmA (bactofilin family)